LVAVTAILLSIPLIAMQFTHQVHWTASDFVVAGVLLLGTGSLYLVGSGWMKTRRARARFAALLLVGLMLIWAELAVRIF